MKENKTKNNTEKMLFEEITGLVFDKQFGYNINDLKQWTTVNINFYNMSADFYDEAQFDVENLKTPDGQKELAELLITFCKENDIPLTLESIENISYVRDADSYEELMDLEAKEEGYCFREE